jgi:hypothetical protein
VLKMAIAGVLVVCAAFYLLKPYLENTEKLKLIELKKAMSAQTLPLRLQAYERLILLTDRINPANMLLRLNVNDYTAAELHALIINEVRNEFQHNITQQLYVSASSWLVIKRIKDESLALAKGALQNLPPNASGLDLGKTMLGRLSQLESDPYDTAAALLRADIEALF